VQKKINNNNKDIECVEVCVLFSINDSKELFREEERRRILFSFFIFMSEIIETFEYFKLNQGVRIY